VMVDDDGPGIPEHLRISVLQPFVRGTSPQRRTSENKTDENYPHIGLGLAIALAILEQHAGRLVIQTNESGDCRITTWWPNSWKQQAESPGEGG
jgi:two-component system osmolarity sensor histidine kinase EnvZ